MKNPDVLIRRAWYVTSVWLCLLLTTFSAAAADNDAVISSTIASNAVILPRTIFTNTWTIQNTGTTTWTPTASGYTLNMIARDTMGAGQLYANTASKRYTPSAVIGSGKSIPTNGIATFTMTFIAPVGAGTYTNTFQLNSASSVYFGPPVTVQIVVPPGGNTNQYDRARTVSYANNYAGLCCRDGYFWTNGSGYYFYGTNASVPTNLIGDDCAHFVSSCIGSQANEHGGGLTIPSRVPPTYGEPGAGRLVNTVLIAPGYAQEVFSLTNMLPGDLVGWNWEGDTNIANLDHVTLYIGNGLLASHAASALGVSANTWYQSSESSAVRHLIHILDAPTLNSTMVSNKLALSWGTNWAGYLLQSSSSMGPGAAWATATNKVTKVGVLNTTTNTMVPGAVFFRLVHP